jgi:Domain of unknown function (DUF6484)
MRKAGACIAAGIAICTFLAASTPAYARSTVALTHLPSALIRVTDGITNLPVVGAEVVVAFIEGDPDHPIVVGPVYSRVANPGGVALFRGLPEGDYIASVAAAGYVQFGDGAHGDRPPRGAHIVVSYATGGGDQNDQPARLRVDLVPLACRTCG